GANDVANAFGSSVAARTLSMRQALLIAAVCEFGGSVLLGGEVTRTVASGIASLTSFERHPEMYMYGMLCAMVSSGTWLIIATYLELPVSTTHSIAGAVLGFAFVYGGPKAVIWLQPQEEFPYMRGMVPIVVSWFISPLLSGLAAALLFFIVRTAILRREASLELAFWALPLLVLITVFINSYFVLYKGADTRITWSSNKSAWVSACIAGGCTVLTVFVGMPLVRQSVYRDVEASSRNVGCHMTRRANVRQQRQEASTASDNRYRFKPMDLALCTAAAIVLHGTQVNVHDAIFEDPAAQRVHSLAEVFDPATEDAFKYLQVLTAICDSFSHGANDVANSVGPFTAIWFIYRFRRIDYMAALPIWILVLGGAGIVMGLATYGYNIIRAIGVRLSAITPSRGFCIELSTALVVALASKYGLPISTTHCQVGATAGMGLMEGSSGLNWRLSMQFFAGWVVTLLLTGLMSAALFAAGAYAPCIQQSRDLQRYEDALLELATR
ncbi:hypothetical protein VOLCADRAFT_70155, partial [Volvox carteri f. nagariensis]